jgi:hypothetical protein
MHGLFTATMHLLQCLRWCYCFTLLSQLTADITKSCDYASNQRVLQVEPLILPIVFTGLKNTALMPAAVRQLLPEVMPI